MSAGPQPCWVRPPVRDGRPLLVHVNTTATGGGVAELLHRLIPAQHDDGISVAWAVVAGDPSFFALTKAVHHLLHGKGDPRVLGDADAAALYRSVLRPQGHWLAGQLREGDTVSLHDPQTLGLAPILAARGIRVVWHLHIGTTDPSAPQPDHVWRFFADELDEVDVILTARPEFVPATFPRRAHIAAPAIDPESPKNLPLSAAQVETLLTGIGLLASAAGDGTPTTDPVAIPDPAGLTDLAGITDLTGLTDFTGTTDLAGIGVDPSATIDQLTPVPANAPMVLQVARWDPLKDVTGVLRCLPGLPADAHLVLAGPDPHEVSDDPEGLAVLAEVRAAYRALPMAQRRRVHLVTLSMRHAWRNALLVNALQRRADVVLQKSLQEGFGLTVTEAMHKSRPVVAAAVGGLALQVVHGETGLLVDPTDYPAVAAAVTRLLVDRDLAGRLGARAAAEVARLYHTSRLVADYRHVVHQPPVTAEALT